MTLEGEQKYMVQSINDLTTWLQMNWSKNNLNNNEQSQAVLTNQFELKLLKQERNSMSETMAQLNLQTRQLNDEKLDFETEKKLLEQEKVRLHKLQAALQLKIAEADETKKVWRK